MLYVVNIVCSCNKPCATKPPLGGIQLCNKNYPSFLPPWNALLHIESIQCVLVLGLTVNK